MPCVIRKVVGSRYENFLELAAGEWKLTPQVDALREWLTEHHRELDREHEWIADIGFELRNDATGGGPVISVAMMKLCVECRMDIFLSEYGRGG